MPLVPLYFWGPRSDVIGKVLPFRIVHSMAIYLSTVTHPNQTESMFDWQFSDLNYIKIKLNLTAE